jgi:hypothetical protein
VSVGQRRAHNETRHSVRLIEPIKEVRRLPSAWYPQGRASCMMKMSLPLPPGTVDLAAPAHPDREDSHGARRGNNQ